MILGNMREKLGLLLVSSALILVTAISAVVSEHPAAFAQHASPTDRPAGILGAKDHRVRVSSDKWPWSAIGRVNVVAGTARGLCTGTLIGPRRVLTAAHCLFDTRTNDWVKPSSIHFVVGQARDKFLGHSLAESFLTSPQFTTTAKGEFTHGVANDHLKSAPQTHRNIAEPCFTAFSPM